MAYIKRLHVFILALILISCERPHRHITDILLMDTFVRIEVRDSVKDNAQSEAVNAAIERMKYLEKQFSYFETDGELARINRLQKDKPNILSHDMLKVLKVSRTLCEKTGGAFDITMEPLLSLWFSCGEKGGVPNDAEIAHAKTRVGLGRWFIDEDERSIVFKADNMHINVGGIAKGYIVDQGIEVLEKHGLRNALINAGGDMYCMGEASGEGWSIGIRDPEDPGRVIRKLRLTNKAIATSGSYERFLVLKNGEKISHIIDPRTGYPVKNALQSVSVIANDCMTADALATVVYVLGAEDGISFIENFDGAECVIITKDGNIHTSGTLGCPVKN